MAKKPSSKTNKRTKKPLTTAAKGGGIMSINKARTSLGMKIIIILIIISFVTLFFYGGVSGFIELFKKQAAAEKVDAIAAAQAKHEAQVTYFTNALASAPTSYTLAAALGNAEFDWAQELSQASQTSTTAASVAQAHWTAARKAYAKALKLNKKADSGTTVDYSVATYYSGETTAAIAIATKVVASDPTFPPTYVNLGIFFETLGDNARAIAAYQKYLQLDPTNKTGNVDFAKQQLKSLGGSIPSTATPASGATSITP